MTGEQWLAMASPLAAHFGVPVGDVHALEMRNTYVALEYVHPRGWVRRVVEQLDDE